jgi:sigma-B regulation protein RsbU (phosphoserine phosphatase)
MSVQLSSHIVLGAHVQELERLSRWIAKVIEAHHLPPRLASHVDLCLTEIVTNIISHAYAQTTAPTDAVAVNFARESAQIIVKVEDCGIAFDPVAHVLPQLPTSLDNAEIGGSGLRLVREFVDRLDYRREAGVNRLTMVFLC